MNDIKLLVVDDETDFAEFVAEVAMGMGFDVSLTDNSTKFTTLYTPDTNIIILDLFMPGVDGIELLRFLYNNASKASLIFMSGKDQYVLHSAQKLALEQGISVLGILQKPFRAEELEYVLAKYDRQSAPQAVRKHETPSLDEIRQAIAQNEMYLEYQPQINIADQKVIGVEALLRWTHPTKGEIPPSFFIPIAEENGMISDISEFVTKTAIQQLGIWNSNGHDFRMSINFSPKILDDLDMPEKLAQHATNCGANISKIMVEVTETSLMSDVTQYMDILARLRMKGFRLAIDDFGTGFSSLQQLVRAPFSELKIDQVFVRKMITDKDCRTIVEISILLAHKMGMKVIAEGIQDENIWKLLKNLGCDEGQGFWISKALPAKEVIQWIDNWSSK